MKIILIKNVDKVGVKNEIKNVTDGFARNYLLPKKLAIIYNDLVYKKILNENKDNFNKENNQKKLGLNDEQLIIIFQAKSTATGNLFAQINKEKIVEKLKNQHQLNITSKDLIISQPIKKIGDYLIGIKPNHYNKIKLMVKKYEEN